MMRSTSTATNSATKLCCEMMQITHSTTSEGRVVTKNLRLITKKTRLMIKEWRPTTIKMGLATKMRPIMAMISQQKTKTLHSMLKLTPPMTKELPKIRHLGFEVSGRGRNQMPSRKWRKLGN